MSNVIVVDLNVESRSLIESMCLGCLLGLLSRAQDEVWDSFEKLALDIYKFEQARDTLGYLTHSEYAFHSKPRHQVHFGGS